jgi:hypothetical protein
MVAMPMTSPVQRLQRLNAMLTALNPKNKGDASEIHKAVDFFIKEVEAEATPAGFPEFAKEILKIHTRDQVSSNIAFWSIDLENKEPLWLHASFMDQLEALAGQNPATLVIYGLQDSVVYGEKYWTEKLEKRYAETRDFFESIAAEHQAINSTLNLIYI